MTRLLKTILFSLLFFSLILFIFPTPARAADDFVHPYKTALEDPSMNLAKYSLYNLDYLLAATTKRLINYPPTSNDTGLGLFGALNAATSTFYAARPVNTASYIADITNRFKPSTAHAAVGDGAEFLSPTLEPWKAFRNIAYLFFIIIFVALGFMIMFRTKLDPQTTIGIQQSIPKIIVSLILVTFSYAIAGFIVDIAFLGGNLITQVVASKPCPGGAGRCIFESRSRWDRWDSEESGIDTPSVWPLDILSQYANSTEEGGRNILNVALEGLFKTIGGIFVNKIDGWEGFFEFIIAITVVGATFKIFFSLLTKYVTIIISTVFMPLAFLWGALPGKQNPGTQMIKSLLSASLAFPAVMIFLGLAYYFADSTSKAFGDIPPFYITKFSSTGEIASSFVAIGMLMITPQIPAAIDKALETGPGAGAGAAEIGGILKKLPIIGGLMG